MQVFMQKKLLRLERYFFFSDVRGRDDETEEQNDTNEGETEEQNDTNEGN